MFQDRLDAARQLAKRLLHYKGKHPLVLAIPRGGVPMGKIIADTLAGDLDVVLVHKLGHPRNQEFAIGAIDEEGTVYLEEEYNNEETRAYLKSLKSRQLERLKSLRAQYTPLKQRIDPAGRTVIIVDDGIATGWTVKAAIAFLKRARTKRIVIATPVGPMETIIELSTMVDEMVCLATPGGFQAVGQFYIDFSQVTDDEVAEILRTP